MLRRLGPLAPSALAAVAFMEPSLGFTEAALAVELCESTVLVAGEVPYGPSAACPLPGTEPRDDGEVCSGYAFSMRAHVK